nr:carbonic anhydrase IV c [Misgurnus anguillicaudatus]
MTSVLFLSSLLLTLKLCSGEWCYQSQFSSNHTCKEPANWYQLYPMCGGQSQSPINIVTLEAKYESKLTSFIFEGHKDAINISVENHENSVHFSLPSSVRVTGGGLTATYKAVQFHLHWGDDKEPGSEHAVDGKRYPVELHIVHIKEQYSSMKEAKNDSTGVAVLAFFFELSSEPNKNLDKIIEALGRVRYEGNHSAIVGFRLADIVPAASLRYYRYSGSLTTPGCDQIVVWTVFNQTLPITQKQVALMTQQVLFETDKPLTGIFRPLQNLNKRIVYTSMKNHGVCVLPGLITLFLCFFCAFGQQRCF